MSDLSSSVATWCDLLERSSPHASPCRYLTPAQWATMREAALDFCTRFGAEAHGLGWTAPQLFGAQPEAGEAENRVTLWISDSLKQRIKAAAAANKQSLNTWVMHCLERCASAPTSGR